jgi:hypothetical protein
VKHYRINKVAAPGGRTLKAKDILAADDNQAVARAEDDEDCPVCEVYRAGEKIGAVLDAGSPRCK